MEYLTLGSLNMSLVDLGSNKFAWRTDATGTSAVVDAALDAGIDFFDTADVYGAGQSEVPPQDPGKAAATNAIVATKFGMKMSRDYLEGSAKDVGPSLSSSAATSTTFGSDCACRLPIVPEKSVRMTGEAIPSLTRIENERFPASSD